MNKVYWGFNTLYRYQRHILVSCAFKDESKAF